MPFQDLSKFGYRPEGASEGPVMEGIISTIEAGGKFVDSYLQGQEKTQKKAKDKIDAYVTLRKAGYPEKEAYEAVNNWDYTKLKGISGAGDLETKKTQAEIDKISADIDYTKAKKEALGNGGGYETADDIPKTQGGLPLKAVKQDKKTGLWYGDYGTSSGSFDLDRLDMEGGDSGGGKEKTKWTPPNWLSNIIGKFEKKAAVNNAPQNVETKVVQGVTYTRGTDGKWHKQK